MRMHNLLCVWIAEIEEKSVLIRSVPYKWLKGEVLALQLWILTPKQRSFTHITLCKFTYSLRIWANVCDSSDSRPSSGGPRHHDPPPAHVVRSVMSDSPLNFSPQTLSRDPTFFAFLLKVHSAIVFQLYRPVGVRVMLVGLEIWSYRDQIEVSSSPEQTLSRFLEWRQRNLLPRMKHDNAQFIT